MRPYELIVRKRNGRQLHPKEIRHIIQSYTAGELQDYQMSALLMAIYFQGMSPEELTAWTEAMLYSGEVLDLSDIPGVKVDKHSTGGVGDKVSLPLAPLVASLGVVVPMVSGRGLGHTGGTLDKLESIPGFRTDLSIPRFREILRTLGACLIGQTSEIAPADKKLYALRDVTGTVDSIPLIASSIMSKKLAEGIDALVLDVKYGVGAFMQSREDARLLAETMIAIGTRMGKRMRAYLTNMDQPLGYAVGNSLEVIESIEVLQGKGPVDLVELTVKLGAEMVLLANLADDLKQAEEMCKKALRDGSALERFRQIIAAQGGDPRVLDDISLLPLASTITPITSEQDGFVQQLNALEIGLASVDMGAGRASKEDIIDPGVGIVLQKKVGDKVSAGEPLALLYHHKDVTAVGRRVLSAFTIGPEAPPSAPLILDSLSGEP